MTTTIAIGDKMNVLEKIEHRGNKWVVLTHDGSKVLGEHDTEEQAKKQLAAIEISKHGGGKKSAAEALKLTLKNKKRLV